MTRQVTRRLFPDDMWTRKPVGHRDFKTPFPMCFPCICGLCCAVLMYTVIKYHIVNALLSERTSIVSLWNLAQHRHMHDVHYNNLLLYLRTDISVPAGSRGKTFTYRRICGQSMAPPQCHMGRHSCHWPAHAEWETLRMTETRLQCQAMVVDGRWMTLL